MSFKLNRIVFAAALTVALSAAAAAHAERKIVSYDPVTPVTKTLAEGGFTFVYDEGLFSGQRVRSLLSTQADAEARLRPVGEKELGASLDSLVGGRVEERDLYEILPEDQGAPLIRAACPGSDRAWLAFGRLRRTEDLRIQAIGRYADGGKVHHCATLDFSWRGEWKLPERVGSRRPDLGPSPVPR